MDSSVRVRLCVRSALLSSAAACIVLAAGCSGSQTPTAASRTQPTVATVTVGVAGNVAPTLAPGAHLQLWAVATYADQSSADVTNSATWQSSTPSIATVSRDGVLTATSEGAVDVNAVVGRVSGALHVTIERPGCNASMLSPPIVALNAFEHAVGLTVTTPQSDCRWTARSDADWVRFGANRTTYDPGQSGSGSLSYNVLANTHPDARTAHVTISFTSGAELVHSVAQEHPVSCSYVVTPDDGYFRAAGGAGSFDVTATPADCRWTATAFYDFYGIALTSNGTGVGSGRVTYVVRQTPSAYEKEGFIVIAGLSGANPAATHKIHIAAQ